MSSGVGTRHQRAFHYDVDGSVEAEYDRLRELAHKEAEERNRCFQRSRDAYSNGDGAGAKELSNQGKRHAANMDQYNKQASDYIFRENNASGRVDDDEIDLHGQYVEEAECIVKERILADRAAGRARLCVITGKGIHSNRHIPKLKPAVEAVFDHMGLNYHTDDRNTGQIIVELGGSGSGYTQPSKPHHGFQPHHGSGGQHQGQHQQLHHGLQPHLGSGGQHQGQHQQLHHGLQPHLGSGGQHQGQHQQPHQGQDQEANLLGLLFGCIQKECCNVM